MSHRTKILLGESEIPTHWVNLMPDLPGSPSPPLRPDTLQPAGPGDLSVETGPPLISPISREGAFYFDKLPPGSYQVRAADTTLGRNFSSGGATATVPVEIVAPGTLYGPRVYQVDARVSKIIPAGRLRIQANFDLFNVLNANPVLQQNNVYGTNGSTWLQPQNVMSARLAKVGVQVNF